MSDRWSVWRPPPVSAAPSRRRWCTQCLSCFLVGVVKQHRRQALTHVPFQVIGEHAQKDMRTDPIGQPVVDRADVQIDGLDAAKGSTFHQRRSDL